jgi:hypothetical protein
MVDRYPVAGQVIGIKLWFGLDLRDVAEALLVPFVAIAIPELFPISSVFFYVFGIAGLVLGGAVLWLKNDAQRPVQYMRSVAQYYLTENTYYKRKNRDKDLGKEQDVLISLMGETDGDSTDSGE